MRFKIAIEDSPNIFKIWLNSMPGGSSFKKSNCGFIVASARSSLGRSSSTDSAVVRAKVWPDTGEGHVMVFQYSKFIKGFWLTFFGKTLCDRSDS